MLRVLQDHPEHFSNLLEQLKRINSRAEEIHFGVHYKRTVLEPHGKVLQDAISGSATLQALIVDALGSVFEMIVQAVRDARIGTAYKVPKCLWSGSFPSQRLKVSHIANYACGLLEAAKDQLISDSTGIVSSAHIGPILTPQALLILLLERLVNGVYGSGSFDVVAVLDESLARLVSLRL